MRRLLRVEFSLRPRRPLTFAVEKALFGGKTRVFRPKIFTETLEKDGSPGSSMQFPYLASRSRLLRRRRILPAVDHSVQMCRRVFDVKVLVLACAAFRSKHSAAMDFVEIPVRKFVVSLGIFRTLIVDSKIPLAKFRKTVKAKEFVFVLSQRPMLTPRIPFVEYKLAFVDKVFGMIKCSLVEGHGHN
jgi:hypothetical protein